MNAIRPVVELVQQQTTSLKAKPVMTGQFDATNATLEILPLEPRARGSQLPWLRARQMLGQLSKLPVGWNGGSAEGPDPHTLQFAAVALADLERSGVPAPSINPSPDGAIYAEWHFAGLDLEVIFEAPYVINALIEDAEGEIPAYEGADNNLQHSISALRAGYTRL